MVEIKGMRLLLIWSTLAGLTTAFCPDVFKNQTTCTCYDYLDGAVIKCSGPEGPLIVEKLKASHVEIRELTLEKANIVEIGPRAFRNLRIKKLILDKNRIKSLHKNAFDGLQNVLQELSISQNRLTEVPTAALAGMRALNVLNLRCNRIQDLEMPVFQNLSSLIDINLSCNQICSMNGSVFENIRGSLQSLTLDNNCLTEFPSDALLNMENLIALHLKTNLINELPEDSLTNLTTLSMLILTGNNISYIHPQAVSNCPNLRYLYLAENAISSFDEGAMAQFDQAQVVDISFNQLSHIPADVFSGLESLQHINFESNAIKEIAPGAFSGTPLLLLWLPNNCISNVSASMFQGAPFLRQVSLSNNNIENIEPMSFAHLVNLHTLDLAFNKISELRNNAIAGSDHLTVRLQENPFVCGEDGFHIMNGNEAINLTTEANVICRTNWRIPLKSTCPKYSQAVPRPIPSPCCEKPAKPAVVTTTSTTAAPFSADEDDMENAREHSGEGEPMEDFPKTSSTIQEVTTTTMLSKAVSSSNKISQAKKAVEEDMSVELEDDEEDERIENNEDNLSSSMVEASTIPSATTTKAASRTVNMERFLRLSKRPKIAASSENAVEGTKLRSRFNLPAGAILRKPELMPESTRPLAATETKEVKEIEFNEDEKDTEMNDEEEDEEMEDGVNKEESEAEDDEEGSDEYETDEGEKEESTTMSTPPSSRPPSSSNSQESSRPVPARVSARQRVLPPWLRVNKPAVKEAVPLPDVDFNADETETVVAPDDEMPARRRV